LQDGDIVNIDVTIYKDGFHLDLSDTFLVGNVDPEAQRLVRTTKEALEEAITVVKPGNPINIIGQVISEYAQRHGFSVSPDIAGHGVGRTFHTTPLIFHTSILYSISLHADAYLNIKRRYNTHETWHGFYDWFVVRLLVLIFSEPILMEGKTDLEIWPDNWTAVSLDCGWSAQFEQTVVVTSTGVEILTKK
jgi:methionyl aminopeptidase